MVLSLCVSDRFISATHLSVVYSVESSAYISKRMSDISRLESFMNMMKSKGQSIETCGTSRPEVGLTAHCRISSTDNVRQGETGTRPACFHGNHIDPVLVKLTHGQPSQKPFSGRLTPCRISCLCQYCSVNRLLT